MKSRIIVAFCLLLIVACDDNNHTIANKQYEKVLVTLTPKPSTNRWYTLDQVETGRIIFASNCAVCHGAKAEQTVDWKTIGPDGFYPPPPLNGTAHAWHHPLDVLVSTIYNGGAPFGGKMPAFKSVLTTSQIVDVVASFQHYWSDEVYQHWLDIENASRQ